MEAGWRPAVVARLSTELPRMLRFGAVGVLNTALGFSIIWAALSAGWGDVPANAAGYACGLCLSFVLNSRWTFAGNRKGSVGRFALTFLVAYSANLVVVLAARAAGLTGTPLVHLAAMAVYTVVFYVGSSRFAFTPVQNTPH